MPCNQTSQPLNPRDEGDWTQINTDYFHGQKFQVNEGSKFNTGDALGGNMCGTVYFHDANNVGYTIGKGAYREKKSAAIKKDLVAP